MNPIKYIQFWANCISQIFLIFLATPIFWKPVFPLVSWQILAFSWLSPLLSFLFRLLFFLPAPRFLLSPPHSLSPLSSLPFSLFLLLLSPSLALSHHTSSWELYSHLLWINLHLYFDSQQLQHMSQFFHLSPDLYIQLSTEYLKLNAPQTLQT